ncbi:uncharacterized protein J7T54_008266 [Emericellopsis cladophorae]|uniref:Uncharacterized protein n=1 Tax=Emericellopsis cladophorae TaxID=2686198 RepID=A0A9P9XWR5_9HYPO|nr:uncharacterized protein J7T54_008266 [Emericellopsis cladophorae]KAI6779048.1 hypothetical protein J7T54_008266 [Emericellopsis cladophorae]
MAGGVSPSPGDSPRLSPGEQLAEESRLHRSETRDDRPTSDPRPVEQSASAQPTINPTPAPPPSTNPRSDTAPMASPPASHANAPQAGHATTEPPTQTTHASPMTAPPNSRPASTQSCPESAVTPGRSPSQPAQATAQSFSMKPVGRVKVAVPKALSTRPNIDRNFAVMQMGPSAPRSTAMADNRERAAQRSSEATQAAAMAGSSGNRPSHARHIWRPSSPKQQSASPAPQAQFKQSPFPLTFPSSQTTKDEQARMLTFLRSLHPVIVVDQLCKALAYFGGIPGAPPPPSIESFPHSLQGHGSGAFLVGWLSEIFPPADFTKPPFSNFPSNPAALTNVSDFAGPFDNGSTAAAVPAKPTAASATATAPATTQEASPPQADIPLRRKRGRPKGSKSKTPRKDKGIKKDLRLLQQATNDTDSLASTQTGPQPASQAPPETPTGTGAIAANPDADRPSSSKRGRPKGSRSRVKPVPTPNLPPGIGTQPYNPQQATSTANASLAPFAPMMATTSAPEAVMDDSRTQNQYSSAYADQPAHQKPHKSIAEATLSQHAQNWADPPADSPWVPMSPQQAARPAPQNSTHASVTQTVPPDARKRKSVQDAAPQALPELERRPHDQQYQQPSRSQRVDAGHNDQAKRRRVSGGPRSASTASNMSQNSNHGAAPMLSQTPSGNYTSGPNTRPAMGQNSQQPRPYHQPPPQYQQPPPPQQQQHHHHQQRQQQQQQQQQQQKQQQHNNAGNRGQQQYYPSSQPQSQYSQYKQASAGISSNNGNTETTGNREFSEYPASQTRYLSMQYAMSANNAVPGSQGGNGGGYTGQGVFDAFGRR